MIFLIILLLITHVAVLIYINKYITAYKLNNHNYITSELKKLEALFLKGTTTIGSNIDTFTKKSAQSFEKLKAENTNFINTHKTNFNNVTRFIKQDYRSLTQMLKKNNDLLHTLLKRTEDNITKNSELKPILVNSSEALEKVYSKIKMLITGYEKSLHDIKGEMESALLTIENTMDSKIKQLAVNGEKTMRASVENSTTAISKVTEETNSALKKVLRDNQIKVLIEKVENMDTAFKEGFVEILTSVNQLDKVFLHKLDEQKRKESDKKGFFKF